LSRFKADPNYCAVAVFRGSWERLDTTFADAVGVTHAKGDAPNFDMPNNTYFDSSNVASANPNTALTAPAGTSDDRQRGWSSALFPVKPLRSGNAADNGPSHDRPPDGPHLSDLASAASAVVRRPADSLFVPRSSERRE